MTSIQIRRLGPKRPNTWESEKPQSGNPVQLVETPQSDASALLKASAATSTAIPMLQARDPASVPSLMQSLALQMNMPAPTLCLLHPLPCAAVLAPTHATPSTAVAGSTKGSFTHAN